MVRLEETIRVTAGPPEAFRYTADLANLADWDPGISASEQVSEGPVGPGARFRVVVAFGPRRVPMTYEITAYQPDERVVLAGEGAPLRAVDEIRFAAVEGGTEITYAAEISFKGALRLVEPFMRGTLHRVGKRAVAGLQAALSG